MRMEVIRLGWDRYLNHDERSRRTNLCVNPAYVTRSKGETRGCLEGAIGDK